MLYTWYNDIKYINTFLKTIETPIVPKNMMTVADIDFGYQYEVNVD